MNNKTELKKAVAEKMNKMFFTTETIQKYVNRIGLKELESINLLLDDETTIRTKSRRARLIKTANFPAIKSFDDYDFSGIKFPSNFDKDSMLSLDFIKNKQGIVFYGGCGTGKTHATIALGLKACNKDFKVKFFTLTSLVMYLKHAKENGTLEHALKLLNAQDLICLDEWGYLPLDLESGQFVFSVIANAYENTSLIITTNLPFSEWGPMFTDEQLAAAIIDRIVHYGHLIQTGSIDWRLEHALMKDN